MRSWRAVSAGIRQVMGFSSGAVLFAEIEAAADGY
jgi:hypothetical protein